MKSIKKVDIFNTENLDRDNRILNFYLPYYNLLRESLLYIRPKYVISTHSFTPYYEDNPLRDFEIGIMFRDKGKLVESLQEAFENAGLKSVFNQPYDMNDGVVHAQESMLSWAYPDKTEVVLIEFRNDYCLQPVWRKKIIDTILPVIEKLNI